MQGQLQASDPRTSAFVSAHAGSGKTKVLVDRLLRLMLAGADPARILCLTYTKAAAAEMAIRLQKELGRWVTLPDEALLQELAKRDVDPAALPRARALFAQVLDLPGGMRIGTIHSFCQSLLKRFPLEAAISPHFTVMEEPDRQAELDDALEKTLPTLDESALAELAGLINAQGFADLVSALETARGKLAPAAALTPEAASIAMRRAARILSADLATLRATGTSWPQEAALKQALTLAAEAGSDKFRDKAGRMLLWLSLEADLRIEHLEHWIEEFCLAGGEARGPGAFANKKLAAQHPHIITLCTAEQERLLAMLDEQRAHRMAAASLALLRAAAPIVRAYAEAKARSGLLDFTDLIDRTETLLRDDQAGSAWVLYKLDGGLDHLLLDEVQDTAPDQWRIAAALTADFFAGAGARPETALARTIFAVGDRKQSIYSFQGAEPEQFERWRSLYRSRVQTAGSGWHEPELDTSFRSTAPVLSLVDAVFAGAGAADGVREVAETLRHLPHRAGQAGRVELWPLAPRPPKPQHEAWSIPKTNAAQISAPQTLVNEIARWVAAQTDGSVRLASEDRPLRPGDILVLVRRRGEFAAALVRALKARGVPVAGLDRIALTEQAAVRDLISLCEALLLPEDDLALAEMLVSPLGGLTDESLMHLAMGREGRLWETLRARAAERPDWQAAYGFFAHLLGRVDYATPHALLAEALGPCGGRARLFGRLGPEAAEPVDELLEAALGHAAAHPPSLQGFLHWLHLVAADVKREPEAAGDAVRVMTVHGAKGLEAPLVLLPDTTAMPPDEAGLCWGEDEESSAALPLWAPNKAFRCAATDALRAEQAAKSLREYNRLLYVALTRARDRLVVCGWEPAKTPEACWYQKVASGMQLLGATASAFLPWTGELLNFAAPQTASPVRPAAKGRHETSPIPAWAGAAPDWRPAPLPAEPRLPRPLAPSRPDGVEYGPLPASRSPLAARQAKTRFARGLAMHSLLQHLPDLPEADRAAAALAFARHPSLGIENSETLADAALAVLRDPALAALFGPGSRAEQPIAGLAGEQVVHGQIDRLAVLPDQVLIADYKTGLPPETTEKTPVRYLRQMAAYRAVLSDLYPGRKVVCSLVWTDGPLVAILPPALLDRHAPEARAA